TKQSPLLARGLWQCLFDCLEARREVGELLLESSAHRTGTGELQNCFAVGQRRDGRSISGRRQTAASQDRAQAAARAIRSKRRPDASHEPEDCAASTPNHPSIIIIVGIGTDTDYAPIGAG